MTEPTDEELNTILCAHWPAFAAQSTLVKIWVRDAVQDAIDKWGQSAQETKGRKVFVCTHCDGVYADQPVTQCDCMPDENTFTEGWICFVAPAQAAEPVAWYEGNPPFPQDQEWFIAETIYGDKAVLRSLDEGREHKGNYAFKTADETYMKAEIIKRWMQFPDCEYLPPTAPQPVVREPQWSPASTPPKESDGEVLVRMADGRCEIAWATYWHGSSNAFAQWTFRDPDEEETPVEWMLIPHGIKGGQHDR